MGTLAVAAFVLTRLDPEALEALQAYRSGLYLQPWRAVTSLFVHYDVPHLLFNVVTLGILGLEVVRSHGTGRFLAAFFVAGLVGQVVHTLVGPGYVYGISGGVCGLYGFLLERRWKGGLWVTLRSWPMGWIYPVALVGLLVADIVGGLDVANTNHLVGIATGWLIARASRAPGRLPWPAAAGVLVVLSIVLTTYRPWDPVWQAVHAAYGPDAALLSIPCTAAPGPPSVEVASAPAQVVTLLSERPSPLTLSYLSPEGDLVPTLVTAERARSLRPLRGSVWRVGDDDGRCILWFIARADGVVEVR